jgi:hypothetical protein
MPLNNPFMGAGDVPSYQMSAIPFVTSSKVAEVGTTPIHIQLPNVSRFIVIHNPTEHVLRIGFTENGVKATGGSVSGSSHEQNGDHANYLILSGNQSTGRLELRVKDLFFMRDGGSNSGFSLLAGITPIKRTMFPALTGSEGYIGIG